MKTNYGAIVILLILFSHTSWAQLPAGGQWGCPSIPINGTFDTTCFKRTGEIKLGQGYFDHYGSSDPVYLVIPQNRPSFALSMAVAWSYYSNVLGNSGMSINQWFATMGQENGFATYSGVQLPATTYDLSSGTNVALPSYPRGQNSLTAYNNAVSLNGPDGPYQNTTAGYETTSPYVPTRYPGPASTYSALYNSNLETASMNKTFYDLSIYRRAQEMNGVDLATIESSSNDPYGIEAAQAVAYNLGPNNANSISAPGYALPAGISTNTNWAVNYYSGGVSCYAERVASITAVLDNNEAYAKTHYPSGCGGNVNNWNFYDFYDSQIKWDTVKASVTRLITTMYPDVNLTSFLAKVQAAFNIEDADANGSISFRYEMGSVIDAIVMNLPKDDPGFNAQYAINGTGCKLDCRAPYTTINPSGSTTICIGQSVILTADVDSPTPSTTYQWLKNGSVIAGATGSTYTVTPITAGSATYSVVVCWSANKESNGASTTCCSKPQCDVTITALASCSNCVISTMLTPISNSCTGMANGSIQVDVTTAEPGPFEYLWSGPSSGSFTTAALTYTIPNLKDGKYTVTVRKVADVNCKSVQDVTIIPVTVIKESLTATAQNSGCPVQLNAILVNQKPNTCNVQVSYGALGGFSWDRSFFMDLKVNGSSSLTMFESYPSAGSKDDPWDFYPFNWPNGGVSAAPLPSGAPNVKTISVSDGDTLAVYGITLVPLGTGVPGFIDGGVRLEGASSTVTFTQVGTTTNSTFTTHRYQGAAPANGSRQMGNSYLVTCPVVSPPAYTYSWSPTSGLSNPNISNPKAGVASPPVVYTVTATHPTNTSCKLTASVTVTASCSPLPVDFLYLDGFEEENKVRLIWAVEKERDCKSYIILRSKDGRNFESIGTVSCSNSYDFKTYQFVDQHPNGSVLYYKIAMIGSDDNPVYSSVVEVSLHELSAYMYPNPFHSSFTIYLNGSGEEMVTLKVKDIQGQEIETRSVRNNAVVEIGNGFSAGIYFVELITGTTVKMYKVIKE